VVATGDEGRRFRVGSVTKTFTSALMLQLIEDGQLAATDPLSVWVPAFPNSSSITICQLLGHRSGTADFMFDEPELYPELLLADLGRTFTLEEAVNISAALPPHAPAGKRYRYSNTDYLLLGVIIERTLDTPVPAAIRSQLTGPLGMDDTGMELGVTVDLANGWFDPDPVDGGTGPTVNTANVRDLPNEALISLAGSAGGMTSSLSDLANWACALYGGEVLSVDGTRDLLASTTDADEHGRHGWGIFAFDLRHGLGIAHGHAGNIVGSSALMIRVEGCDTVVVAHASIGDATTGQMLDLATTLIEIEG